MKTQAYTTGSITESIVAFAGFLRSHGLNVGIQETQDALRAAEEGLLLRETAFRYALKTLFCTSPEEREAYEYLYSLYWDTNPTDLRENRNQTKLQGTIEKKANASLVMLGKGKTDDAREEAKNVSGANEKERLKKTDLSFLSDMEAKDLDAIAKQLFREMALRLRRRLRESRKKGRVNLRRTIRRSIGYGGEPLELFRVSQSPKKRRLIILLDVSGSMDKYSFFLMRFICALKSYFRQLEAFVFSTSLTRISKALQHNRIDQILADVSERAESWSGGTRIGASLQEFSATYGKRMLNGSPLVIIMSDGLDTGDTALLQREMLHLHQRARKIVWLNPLKGMKGYAPVAKGMQAALPLVDDFRPAHNLASLMELEDILAEA